MANEVLLGGKRGPRGHRGKRGKRGHRGRRGHDGDGLTGATGSTGATGATGVGATGATGAPGPGGSPPIIAAAIIQADGTVTRSQGFGPVTTGPDPAQYNLPLLTPPADADDALVLATVFNPSGVGISYNLSGTTVNVYTFNNLGNQAQRAFSIVVYDMTP